MISISIHPNQSKERPHTQTHTRTVVPHNDEQGAVAGLDAILNQRPHAIVHLLAHHPPPPPVVIVIVVM
jgi:hypothetical protein